MKKLTAVLMGITMLGASCLAGCNHVPDPDPNPNPDETPSTVGTELQTDRESLNFALEGLYPKGELKDAANGFSQGTDVTGARFFQNGKYLEKFSSVGSRQDVKLELYNGKAARMANVSAGMAFTIPTSSEITTDYTIAKYRTQYTFDDSILTFSAEYQNPYTSRPDAWYVYVNEWAIRHLVNDKYMENQHITRLSDLKFDVTPVDPASGTSDGERAYPTVQHGDLTFRDGYEVYRFDLEIEDAGDIERPFYNIGIIHEVNDVKSFGLFVMKSKSNKAEMMDAILQSYTQFGSKGLQRNYFDPGKPVEDPHWNAETTAFFRQFCSQETKSWGVFSYSMPGEANNLHAGSGNYDTYLSRSKTMQKYIEEEVWGGKKFDVYMTYTHLGSGAADNPQRVPHYYPVDMSKELAGGNGDGTKPVLEFTYQFTTNNNLVDQEVSPMFDIMRGKFDDYFKRLALDIKQYGKPIMFRLNNEMNTDWTSYSGIMNLLDPDIFTMTWKRLYNIFIENGVENVIWVWNPIGVSAPYSGWGEDLCYFPGVEYVQLLGGTCYEFNNYTGDASTQMISFQEHYSKLYEKNKDYFSEYSMIIGEFACGSGGNATGTLGRNRAAQAKWVRDMFTELNAEKPADYVKQIKGLIWFNCNDYSGSSITNRLKFTDAEIGDRPGETYTDLAETWQAFRDGFAAAKK